VVVLIDTLEPFDTAVPCVRVGSLPSVVYRIVAPDVDEDIRTENDDV
jgi:hypothetical protein